MKTNDSKSSVMIGCTCAILIGITSPFVTGFVLLKLWHWFIVPLGVREITMAWAFGLSVIASMLTHQINTQKTPERPMGETILIAFVPMLSAFFALLAGYIASQYMPQ